MREPAVFFLLSCGQEDKMPHLSDLINIVNNFYILQVDLCVNSPEKIRKFVPIFVGCHVVGGNLLINKFLND